MNYVPLVLAIVLLPSIAVAQQPSSGPFETFEAIAARSDAWEVEVITRVAVYRQASTSSKIVETYAAGTHLVAYAPHGPFTKVARPDRGLVGYVTVTHLAPVNVPVLLAAPTDTRATLAALRGENQPKNEEAAVMLSFLLPGGGQFYAGDPDKGAQYLVSAVLATGVGAAITHHRVKQNCSSDGDDTEGGLGGLGDAVACANPRNRLPLYVGLVLSGAVWIDSMVDAPKAVRAYNARLERSALVIEPRLRFEDGALRPGLAARITLP